MVRREETTQLLGAMRNGDRGALDRLVSRTYDELRQIAHQRLVRNRPGETLNTTALVHEAYVRMVDGDRADLQDRAHFLALASRVMRSVLVNYSEAARARKRGGGRPDVSLERVQLAGDDRAVEDRAADVLALDRALETLEEHDPALVRLVEYRFFGGLTYDEIAEVTDRSVPTLKRDWARARGWLHRFMEPPDP